MWLRPRSCSFYNKSGDENKIQEYAHKETIEVQKRSFIIFMYFVLIFS